MLNSEADRLLRTHWNNPQMLAEELYSILTAYFANHEGTFTINNVEGSTQAPLQISGSGDIPLIDFGDLGQIRSADGVPYFSDAAGTPQDQEEPNRSACYPGYITGHVGGSVYNVTIYPNGLSQNGQSVRVTQLQIKSGTTIRADGTVGVLVSRTDNGLYYMQVPVFQRSA